MHVSPLSWLAWSSTPLVSSVSILRMKAMSWNQAERTCRMHIADICPPPGQTSGQMRDHLGKCLPPHLGVGQTAAQMWGTSGQMSAPHFFNFCKNMGFENTHPWLFRFLQKMGV